jgi:hypothetical protein
MSYRSWQITFYPAAAFFGLIRIAAPPYKRQPQKMKALTCGQPASQGFVLLTSRLFPFRR